MRSEAVFFFRDVVLQSLADRKATGLRKNDLIDLALDALKKAPATASAEAEKAAEAEGGQFEKDAVVQSSAASSKVDDLEGMLVANAIQLFLAGYETTSTIMAVCMYFLAKHPDVQDKVRQEVDTAVEEAGSEVLDYARLHTLNYLEAVLLESSRHYPV
jgi:cytochrome P450 family 6